MVLWIKFAVILFLCGSTCAKTDFDLRRTTVLDQLNKGFSLFGGSPLTCRYSKLLSILKDSPLSLDEGEAASFGSVKVKKNHAVERTKVHPTSDSLEEDVQHDDAMAKFEDEDMSGNYLSTYDDLDFLREEETKKNTNTPIIGCDCKIKNDLLDLGHLHYPRYLLNAVCQKEDEAFEYPPKCWRGAQCKPLEYKVRVLTYRSHSDHLQKDPAMSLLPDILRSLWKFKTVTVAAGCFCS